MLNASIDLNRTRMGSGKTAGITWGITNSNRITYTNSLGAGMVNSQKYRRQQNNAIYKIFSMTKVITSVCVMICIERKLIGSLDDSLEKYLPFKVNLQVVSSTNVRTPISAPVTIRNLLTHRSGFFYSGEGVSANLDTSFNFAYNCSLTTTVRNFCDLGLARQPNSQFLYSMSPLILGYVIQIVNGGQSLESFMRQNVLDPLNMTDTFFTVPAAKMDRVAQMFNEGHTQSTAKYDIPPCYGAGDTGLFSTAIDYLRFVQMFLNNGRSPKGARVLSPESVALMQQQQSDPGSGPAWGFGFALVQNYWGNTLRYEYGSASTSFWINAEKGHGLVLMMNRRPQSNMEWHKLLDIFYRQYPNISASINLL